MPFLIFPLQDIAVKGKTLTPASTQQQSASPEDESPDDPEASKKVQESEEFDAPAVQDIAIAASDEGSEEKDDVKESEVGRRTCTIM